MDVKNITIDIICKCGKKNCGVHTTINKAKLAKEIFDEQNLKYIYVNPKYTGTLIGSLVGTVMVGSGVMSLSKELDNIHARVAIECNTYYREIPKEELVSIIEINLIRDYVDSCYMQRRGVIFSDGIDEDIVDFISLYSVCLDVVCLQYFYSELLHPKYQMDLTKIFYPARVYEDVADVSIFELGNQLIDLTDYDKKRFMICLNYLLKFIIGVLIKSNVITLNSLINIKLLLIRMLILSIVKADQGFEKRIFEVIKHLHDFIHRVTKVCNLLKEEGVVKRLHDALESIYDNDNLSLLRAAYDVIKDKYKDIATRYVNDIIRIKEDDDDNNNNTTTSKNKAKKTNSSARCTCFNEIILRKYEYILDKFIMSDATVTTIDKFYDFYYLQSVIYAKNAYTDNGKLTVNCFADNLINILSNDISMGHKLKLISMLDKSHIPVVILPDVYSEEHHCLKILHLRTFEEMFAAFIEYIRSLKIQLYTNVGHIVYRLSDAAMDNFIRSRFKF